MADRCVYASATRGVHDQRWLDALRSQGYSPITVVRRDGEPDQSFRNRVQEFAGAAPILAGPLDTVASALVGLPAVTGLSWGFDLHRMTIEERAALRDLHGLIVDSTATAALATQAGVEEAAITFLPWGVDLVEFSPVGPRIDPEQWAIRSDSPLVVSLRALEVEYGVADIIEAWPLVVSEYSGAHLLIGHDGTLRQELQARVDELGVSDSVTFTGSLPETELPKLLRAANVYVSLSRVDGTSVTLLQAMACGAPVVVSDIPGNQPWVEDGMSGRRVPVGDPDSLASAICEALAQGSAWTAAARSRIERDADWISNRRRLRSALGAS